MPKTVSIDFGGFRVENRLLAKSAPTLIEASGLCSTSRVSSSGFVTANGFFVGIGYKRRGSLRAFPVSWPDSESDYSVRLISRLYRNHPEEDTRKVRSKSARKAERRLEHRRLIDTSRLRSSRFTLCRSRDFFRLHSSRKSISSLIRPFRPSLAFRKVIDIVSEFIRLRYLSGEPLKIARSGIMSITFLPSVVLVVCPEIFVDRHVLIQFIGLRLACQQM